ncbi:MAG: hypothetical protein RLZZ401_2019 [Pseudomonadota bacterium]
MGHPSFILAMLFACSAAWAQDANVLLKASPALATGSPPPGAGTEATALQGPVGYVKTVTGLAYVVTDGKPVKATLGTPVMQGSVLKTGQESSLGVTFNDNTRMSFGPQTELKVDEYLYAPAEGKLRFGAKLTRGTLNYISGVIAKLKPDGVTVSTPTGMIGVRGTHFLAKVEPDLAESTPQ